jgi:hypothetical protein
LHLEHLEERATPTVTLTNSPNWVPQGPGPIVEGSTVATGGNVIGPAADGSASLKVGAMNAIAVDPNNAAHLFVATVDGGIWQTGNFTATPPVWSTTTDGLPSLAIESVAFSPVNSGVIYAGTGSSSSDFGGGAAVGVYKSTDGGATWQVLNPKTAASPGGMFTGLRIIRIIPTMLNGGQTVFAATSDGGTTGGVFRSDNGGTSWTRLSGGTSGLPNSGVTDLVENPNNANQFYAATSNTLAGAGAGVYMLDLGVNATNWTPVTNNMSPADLKTSSRIQLSISPAGANPIWASITNGSFYTRVYRGVAGGGTVNWAQVGPLSGGVNQPPDVLEAGFGFLFGAIVADPKADNLVYLSGDALLKGPAATTGYVARGDSTLNTWTAITPNDPISAPHAGTVVPTSNGVVTSPHADSRGLNFADGMLVLTCDGGIYQCTSPSSTTLAAQTWTSISGNIQDTEFFNTAFDAGAHAIFGGAQDNGTDIQSGTGSTTWNAIRDSATKFLQGGGDGGLAASGTGGGTTIDYFSADLNPSSLQGGVASSLQLADKAGDPRFSGLNAGDMALAIAMAVTTSTDATFGIAVSPGNPKQILFGSGTGIVGQALQHLYESTNAGATCTDITAAFPTTDTITGFAYGGASNPLGIYLGRSDSTIFVRSTAAGAVTQVTTPTSFGGANAVQFVVDPTNFQHAFMLDSFGNIWQTTDAGATAANWTKLTDNLFSIAPQIDSIAIGSGGVLLASGKNGVFRRLPGSGPPGFTWSRVGTGLPIVETTSVAYEPPDPVMGDFVLAGTYGRGAWILPKASTFLSSMSCLMVNGDENGTPTNDTILVQLDPNDPTKLQVFVNGKLEFDDLFSMFNCLIINGGGGNDTINIRNIPANVMASVTHPATGVDVINVGTMAPGLGGDLTGIQGPLTITGLGKDTLNLDSTTSTSPKSGTLNPGSLTGLGMGPGGTTFKGLAALNLTLGPGALKTDKFALTSINLHSVSTSARSLFAVQTGPGQILITGNHGTVFVDYGTPPNFNKTLGTVSLLGSYGPFTLKETFPDPPAAPGHSAVVKGNPTSPGDAGLGTDTGVAAASPAVTLQGPFLGSPAEAGLALLGSLAAQSLPGSAGATASSNTSRQDPARAFEPAAAANLGLTWIDLSWMGPAWLPDSRKGTALAR